MTRILFRTIDIPRGKAKALKAALSEAGTLASLSVCQATVARIYGYASWDELKTLTRLDNEPGDLTLVSGRDRDVLTSRFGIAPGLADRVTDAVTFTDLRRSSLAAMFDGIMTKAMHMGASKVNLSRVMDDLTVIAQIGQVPRVIHIGKVTDFVALRAHLARLFGTTSGTGRATIEVDGGTMQIRVVSFPEDDRKSIVVEIVDTHLTGLSHLGVDTAWNAALATRSGLLLVASRDDGLRYRTVHATLTELYRQRRGTWTTRPWRTVHRTFAGRLNYADQILDIASEYKISGGEVVHVVPIADLRSLQEATRVLEAGHLVIAEVAADEIEEVLCAFVPDDLDLAWATRCRKHLKSVLCMPSDALGTSTFWTASKGSIDAA